MNYITSCPACETQFLLNTEHLKAHRGKVQCGNCEHIFNAKNRLTEVSDDIHSPAEYNARLEVQTNEALQIIDENPIGEVLNIVLEGVPDLENLESSSSELTPSEFNQEANIVSRPKIIDTYDAEQIRKPIVIEDLTRDPKFDKPKFKINYWLVLFGLLLVILAGIQTIYAMRTTIAAEYPQFKPYLVQTCAALQCNIPLPTNLDLLAIDDSDMQEDESHENVIKFSSLLINNAPYAQAYPNIELTLTATDDEPVLRRLIKPAEYLKTGTKINIGLASREELRVNLAINVKGLTVAGYRVLLVY